MSEEIKKVILTITFSIIFLICWSFYPAYSQKMICGPSTEIIESVEKKFAERETERGIDEESAMLFVFTVGTNGSWSLLISPKSNPTALCMPLTGSNWVQGYNKSVGETYTGDVVTVNFDGDGNWRLYYFTKETGNLMPVAFGYGWERLWKFDKDL